MGTYCGKDCNACARHESDRCRSCEIICSEGGCEIAGCCRDKGHESCSTCTQNDSCFLYQSRGKMPLERDKRLKLEAEKAARSDEICAVMRKYILSLFWLTLVGMVVDEASSALTGIAGQTIAAALGAASLLIGLIHAFLLYQMRMASERYRTAAILVGLDAILGFASGMLSIFARDMRAVIILISLFTVVISLVAIYQEFRGHAEVLSDFDIFLSEKWNKLWKWYIGLTVGAILVPFMALVLLIAYCVAIFAVSVLKLVYLWRTADIFKNR